MPKIVDHDQYRKELLTKCFDLFANKGYASVTMRQIAQEIGVSTGTLYHYFPSKQALFWQLYDEFNERDAASMNTVLNSTNTLQERITAIFDYIAQNEDYFFKQFLITSDFYQQQDRTEILTNETLKRNYELNRDFTAKALGIADPALVNFAIALVTGIMTLRLFEGDVVAYDEQAKLFNKMLTLYLQEASLDKSDELPVS
ncbi:TetR/AcrR family transcriptional regulator [Gloeocapsopsis dulcis]|uniref:TetR family transcriptional regulator n=1 Tax=Gloeocapsopsis dulcis AAB1 = 1H9 TaxID=1433147 RepID=A0A6N8FS26_9CHRO|nr:TetR/AcrR family transcriptional regulator [Gloeocapsopsis dulcis]MUL35751.1 TetR family transcriptional regulator [Gloeocapsopsis dulcis AAB1 = 1H9]WNN90965.1 TetR/AcrR family transcriptional regulator [Gloeocapsopsis dulcis]